MHSKKLLCPFYQLLDAHATYLYKIIWENTKNGQKICLTLRKTSQNNTFMFGPWAKSHLYCIL